MSSCEECDHRPDLQVRQARSLDYYLGIVDACDNVLEAIEYIERWSKGGNPVEGLHAISTYVVETHDRVKAITRGWFAEMVEGCDVRKVCELYEGSQKKMNSVPRTRDPVEA